MTSTPRGQSENREELKRRQANDKLSSSIPDGAFTDDPKADSFDKNGRVRISTSQSLIPKGMDLGRFPPNE